MRRFVTLTGMVLAGVPSSGEVAELPTSQGTRQPLAIAVCAIKTWNSGEHTVTQIAEKRHDDCQ